MSLFPNYLSNFILSFMLLSFYRRPNSTNFVPNNKTGNSKFCCVISVFKEFIKVATLSLLIFSCVELQPKKHYSMTFEKVPANN